MFVVVSLAQVWLFELQCNFWVIYCIISRWLFLGIQ